MRKSLIIIATVALLGMLAVYAIPLTAKKATTAHVTTAPTTATTSPNTTQTSTTQATSTSVNQSNLKDGSYTGTSMSNEFGDVQIKLTISSGKISNVAILKYPDSARRSEQISQNSLPTLVDETISAQSANIDSVSGASYTSQSYVESLQSALDQAKA